MLRVPSQKQKKTYGVPANRKASISAAFCPITPISGHSVSDVAFILGGIGALACNENR